MSFRDNVIAFTFVVFFFIAFVLDIANVMVPAGTITREIAAKSVWPPKPVWDAWFIFAESADPLLIANPLWFKFGCALSPFLYGPFYILAVYAFLTKKEWIRIPCLLWSYSMLLILAFITVENFFGEHKTPNVALWTAAYGSYVLFPLYTFFLCLQPTLFSKTVKHKSQ